MNIENHAVRFRHHFLSNSAVLTICTQLDYDTRVVRVGWAVFNPNDDRWVRKVGTTLARERMLTANLSFTLTQNEPILCDYISLRALMLMLGAVSDKAVVSGHHEDLPSSIPKDTLEAIIVEIISILGLLGRRVGLPCIYRNFR
jgi:hypothetical protein